MTWHLVLYFKLIIVPIGLMYICDIIYCTKPNIKGDDPIWTCARAHLLRETSILIELA